MTNVSVNVFYLSFGCSRPRIDKRLSKLQSLIAWVDEEAKVAFHEVADEKQQSRYHDILQRLPLNSTTMLLRKEPFDNLPALKNYSFHGRDTELRMLEDQLTPDKPPTKLTAACLSGPGGVGKTQIVLEFAHRHIGKYDIILYISAESSLKIADSFSDIAHGLGLADGTVQNSNQLRNAVKIWLQKDSKSGTTTESATNRSLLTLH